MVTNIQTNENKLTKTINECTKCNLCKTRRKCVIGDGNIESQIMLVGDSPSEQDDAAGTPFIGNTGILLDKMLSSIGLDRTMVYVCNIMKCHIPNNKTPKEEEINECLNYLRTQFLLMKPKLIILLGDIACKSILDKNYSVAQNHGKVIIRKGIIFVPTFHPSDLIKDKSKKVLAWNDLKEIQEIIKWNDLIKK